MTKGGIGEGKRRDYRIDWGGFATQTPDPPLDSPLTASSDSTFFTVKLE